MGASYRRSALRCFVASTGGRDTLPFEMACRRASSLLLASALLACSREPPPPASDGGAAAPAPAPIAPLPPITVSSLIRPESTISPRDYRDHAASIPGVLTIRAPNKDSQSHGYGTEPWDATFLVTNETTAPLSVRVSDLVFRSPDVAPEHQAQPVAMKTARVEGDPTPVEGGAVTFTVAPRRQIRVDLQGQQKLHVYYHVQHYHEATFAVGDARVVGRGYAMHFRRHISPL